MRVDARDGEIPNARRSRAGIHGNKARARASTAAKPTHIRKKKKKKPTHIACPSSKDSEERRGDGQQRCDRVTVLYLSIYLASVISAAQTVADPASVPIMDPTKADTELLARVQRADPDAPDPASATLAPHALHDLSTPLSCRLSLRSCCRCGGGCPSTRHEYPCMHARTDAQRRARVGTCAAVRHSYLPLGSMAITLLSCHVPEEHHRCHHGTIPGQAMVNSAWS